MTYEHCAIISGGEFSPLFGIEKADFVIACDKGLEYAIMEEVRPDLLVGDFDSYEGAVPKDIPLLSLPVEKDDTDTMAAVRYAVDTLKCKKISLYCVLGGRLDHLLGNIQTAAYGAKNGVFVEIHSRDTEMYALSCGSLNLEPKEGYSLSLISLSDECRGVSISGTKYELENAVITNTFPIGVSNEWKGTAEISLESGLLLVVLSRL